MIKNVFDINLRYTLCIRFNDRHVVTIKVIIMLDRLMKFIINTFVVT